jgi:UDP-N-acetyl-D-glucosamine dehydrogenase
LNKRRITVNGSRILLLGLAYKKNTGDARESPAVRVAELLLNLGADVRASDPHVLIGHVDQRVKLVDASPEEVEAADCVVLLADHDAFDLEAIAGQAKYVLDTRHQMPGDVASVEQL